MRSSRNCNSRAEFNTPDCNRLENDRFRLGNKAGRVENRVKEFNNDCDRNWTIRSST